jgi:hypothetical protein
LVAEAMRHGATFDEAQTQTKAERDALWLWASDFEADQCRQEHGTRKRTPEPLDAADETEDYEKPTRKRGKRARGAGMAKPVTPSPKARLTPKLERTGGKSQRSKGQQANRKGQQSNSKFLTHTGTGRKICEGYNKGTCTGACPKQEVHTCDWTFADGGKCLSTCHTRAAHK